MRKILISAALAASALAVASPAAAQYYPQPQGNAYGYHNNRGQVQRLMVRIEQIRRQIVRLDRRNILSDREARRLNNEANDLQRRVARLGYNGLDSRERYDVERRIANLELRVRREASDGNRYGNAGYNGQYGYGQNGYNGQYSQNSNTAGRWQDPYGNWYEGWATQWQDRDGRWHQRGDNNYRGYSRDRDRDDDHDDDRDDD